MRKILSILIISLILLSGMHFSVANHICGGKYVATKVSFDMEKASCGMESDKETQSQSPIFKNHCCDNEVVSLHVDEQYQPTSVELNKPSLDFLSLFVIPSNFTLKVSINKDLCITNALPPGNPLVNQVSLSRICVFLI